MLMIYSAAGQALSIDDVRAPFADAVKKEESCNLLYSKMCNLNCDTNAVLQCYYGAVTMSMSKYVSNPFTKLSYFKSGKKLIESAVAAQPFNVELRFLRLSVQEHVPSFLGYSDNIPADKKIILQQLKNMDMPKLKSAIVKYIQNSAVFTPAEKKQVIGF